MSKKYIGNLVQSLSGGSGGGGGDTGVGKPYPGSTGGEYFNYYGDDSNKNIASGDYSTARGYKCEASGKYSFASGNNCVARREGEIAIGSNCDAGYYTGYSIAIGKNCYAEKNNIAIGADVTAAYPGGAQNYGGTIAFGRNINAGGVCIGNYLNGGVGNGSVLIGNNLTTASYSTYNGTFAPVYIGRNPEADSFSPSILKIGIGTQGGVSGGTPKTVLESNNDGLVRLPHGLCLDSINTTVNAITAPQDSTNVTTDDQTLATKSYVDANSGGGVGQAYPNSTGGEIFNYYGTDSDANVASGNYSTTIGQKNSTSGAVSFTGGKNNTNKGDYTIMFGSGNQNTATGDYGVILGHRNNNKGKSEMIMIGTNNTANANSQYGVILGSANSGVCYYGLMLGTSLNSQSYSGARLIGDQLTAYHGDQMILGRYNAATSSLTDPHIILACGTGNNDKKNALEIDGTEYKILNNLQLATDTTAVNAITPPQDPQNVTADDQTLVTKSYVSSVLPPTAVQSTVGYFETSLSTSVYPNTDGTPLTLASFTTVPSWANHALVYFHWEGETHFKDIILDRDSGLHLDIWQTSTSGTPLQIRHAHYRLEYTSLDKAITATDYWEYTQDATNNTISGTITGLSNVTYNARILSVVYTA